MARRVTISRSKSKSDKYTAPAQLQRFKLYVPTKNGSLKSITDSNSAFHTKKKKRGDSKIRSYPRPWMAGSVAVAASEVPTNPVNNSKIQTPNQSVPVSEITRDTSIQVRCRIT